MIGHNHAWQTDVQPTRILKVLGRIVRPETLLGADKGVSPLEPLVANLHSISTRKRHPWRPLGEVRLVLPFGEMLMENEMV